LIQIAKTEGPPVVVETVPVGLPPNQ